MKPLTYFTTLTLSALTLAQAEDKKVELKTELPTALFIGTATPIKLANLEPVEVKQKPLMVPEGMVNLAKGKEVTSSDAAPVIGELSMVTDEDKDANDGSYLELGPGKQWVQIDLGESAEVHALWLWHFHKMARAYIDVVVQISDDKEFAKATTVYNNDNDGTLGFGKGTDKPYVETNSGRMIDAKATKGRYVRLYSAGNTSNEMNHYIEVEVFGKK